MKADEPNPLLTLEEQARLAMLAEMWKRLNKQCDEVQTAQRALFTDVFTRVLQDGKWSIVRHWGGSAAAVPADHETASLLTRFGQETVLTGWHDSLFIDAGDEWLAVDFSDGEIAVRLSFHHDKPDRVQAFADALHLDFDMSAWAAARRLETVADIDAEIAKLTAERAQYTPHVKGSWRRVLESPTTWQDLSEYEILDYVEDELRGRGVISPRDDREPADAFSDPASIDPDVQAKFDRALVAAFNRRFDQCDAASTCSEDDRLALSYLADALTKLRVWTRQAPDVERLEHGMFAAWANVLVSKHIAPHPLRQAFGRARVNMPVPMDPDTSTRFFADPVLASLALGKP